MVYLYIFLLLVQPTVISHNVFLCLFLFFIYSRFHGFFLYLKLRKHSVESVTIHMPNKSLSDGSIPH